ncbi:MULTISPECIES: glutaminase [Flavobacteriaceae]|uniref:Glutaminase n=2 Tax=Flavobacteriaceae TaxID=49546 RepID=A0A4Y8AT88_9FLAO|nr:MULTISPECIES: glutaminase [Flavobacteriaceae]TEW73908.1 glutaminase [Gramella jeungdoensis]GGK38623.1 glutaminase [Lutibacter litoralis]
MDYNNIINTIYFSLEKLKKNGEVATYIPELAKVDPNKFGVHITTIDHQHFSIGDANEKFSIQSIAKVLSLTLVYKKVGEKIWERVGVEPSGTAFNSLVQLEYDKGIPRNPLINAGAIVICDILVSSFKDPKTEFLTFLRAISGNTSIDFCARIAESEKQTGYKNVALINLMKSFNNIKNDIDVVMDFYYNLCSIEMTCKELSRTFLFLTTDGIDPISNKKIISESKSKRINAIMQLCGFYDEAGEFAFKVGLPGKSGVGGGIVAIHPNQYSIAVWSPRLNKKGNSKKGMKFLEQFTTKTQLSIF